MKSMKVRIVLAVAFLAAIASQALPAERGEPVEKSAPRWFTVGRLDVSGTDDSNPSQFFAQVVCTTYGERFGVPQTESSNMRSEVRVNLSPAEARALANALIAWADNPTHTMIFTATR